MSDTSKKTITVEATVADVRALLFNLEGYPSWSTAIKTAAIEERDGEGRATKVKSSIDAGVMKDRVTLDYDWSAAPEKLSFSLDDADLLTEMTGSFTTKDNGDDTTDVTYELTVALSMQVPAMMRQKAEMTTIELALNQLKKTLEE
jgi:hypothetical protein